MNLFKQSFIVLCCCFIGLYVSAQLSITQMEYFIDKDPGRGKGIQVNITPGKDLADVSFNIDTSSISVGLHYLYIRVKDEKGIWGHEARILVNRFPADPPDDTSSIVRAEYFLDNDPGIGNSIPVAINRSKNIANWPVNANVNGLDVGIHYLGFRTQNQKGAWSHTALTPFGMPVAVNNNTIIVNSITDTVFCSGDSLQIGFDATGTFNAGNRFSVQLSDTAGNFSDATIIGSIDGTNGKGLINCRLPGNINGNGYRLRVISSNTSIIGDTAVWALVIGKGLNIGADTSVVLVCSQDSIDISKIYNLADLTFNWTPSTVTNATIGTYQLVARNSFGCIDTVRVFIQQDIAVWKGAISEDWNTAGNWSTGKTPGEKTNVIIVAGTPFSCRVNKSVNVASLQVKPSAVLNVESSATITVNGNCSALPSTP